jgi:sugar phosphate isomerase/epimerase
MVKEQHSHADKPRQELRRLMEEAKASGKKASQRHLSISVLGHGDAYINQYLERGRPSVLDYDDRVKLARYFGVDQSLFAPPGAIDAPSSAPNTPAPQPATMNRKWLAEAISKAREAAELWGAKMDVEREAELIARAYEKLARNATGDEEDTPIG